MEEAIFLKHGDKIIIDLNNVHNTLDEEQLFGIQTRSEFIPMSHYSFNGQNQLSYDIDKVIPLSEYLISLLKSGQANHFKGYVSILKQIFQVMLIGDKLFVANASNIVIDIDKIFVNSEELQLKFMYYPFEATYFEGSYHNQFTQLMDDFYQYLGDSRDALLIQSRVMQLLKNDTLDFRVLLNKLDKWENSIIGNDDFNEQNPSEGREIEHENTERSVEKNHDYKPSKPEFKIQETKKKVIKQKTLMSIILMQVIMVMVLIGTHVSGVYVNKDTGKPDVFMILGGTIITIVLVEYLMYKLLIEGKEIFTEKIVSKNIPITVTQKNPIIKSVKPNMGKDQSNKAIYNTTNNYDEEIKKENSPIEGTVLLVSPDEMNHDDGTVLLDEKSYPYLLIKLGAVEERFNIEKDSIKVGRNIKLNDCVIQQKPISSHHATICLKEGNYYIQDEKSTNNTFINDKKIEPFIFTKLENNDVLKLANVEIVFRDI